MKKIFSYLREHLASDFSPSYYALMAVLMGASVWLNFYFFADYAREHLHWQNLTFESWMRNTILPNRPMLVGAYMLFYGVPYYLTVGIAALFARDKTPFRGWEFWAKSLLALAIISFDASFRLFNFVDYPATFSDGDRYWMNKILGNLSSIVGVGIPVMLLWWLYDRRRRVPFLYGISRQGFDRKPYLWMMLIMTGIVGAAACSTHFTDYYPTLHLSHLDGLTLLPRTPAIIGYESVYIFDFIWTEVAFRGLFILGLGAAIGKEAIMPMATIYCLRHFQKPAGEAISSIFGGWILGVLALRTRSILGGVWIHMGIAFLMDVFALISLSLQ